MKLNHTFMLMILSVLTACTSVKKYKSFDEYPVYKGNDLGLTYSPEVSKFRVWAPTASEVKLLLYDNGYKDAAYKTIDMERSVDGTWTKEIEKNLKGKFYTYQIKVDDKWLAETPGMYVKAVGVNGKRGAIIDMSKTDPAGWNKDVRQTHKNFTDNIIYEVHMRDFSESPNSGMQYKGKFLAFTEHGTKNTAGQSTGIDHLKELGVTDVHILPSFDFASIDETKLYENKYNWGYDPLNYDVPEGSYSTNPYDPLCRIREFKEMVEALHKAGIGVIMDVVYNHTYIGRGSHLDLLAPGYFYRHNEDGSWSDASGCGNETASERPMMRKFMIESVVYWAKEYHIDGFRFDLMGVHDIKTMNDIRAALNKIDPGIFVYGEGWTAGPSPLPEKLRAVKKNAKELHNIAVFSDDIRDALRGSWMNPKEPGFVCGADSLEESVKFGVVGATKHVDIDYSKLIYSKAPYANNPTQVINYVSCHDDECLVDKLKETTPDSTSESDLLRFDKFAQTIVFTSQGVPFIYAGEELFRNKHGIRNTFQSPDSINEINWDNKTKYNDLFNYYKDLIALRKAHAAFRMSTQKMVQKHLQFLDMHTPNVVAYMLTDHANGDVWKDILVIYNGNRHAIHVEIPKGYWTVVCHNGEIKEKGLFHVRSTYFKVDASSASILYRE